jgi:hypothetical protein
MVRVQQKKHAAEPQVSREYPAFPAQWFYGVFRALPGDHRLVATVIGVMRNIIASLAPASERQDHTA